MNHSHASLAWLAVCAGVVFGVLCGSPAIATYQWMDSDFVALVQAPTAGEQVHQSEWQLFKGYSYWKASGGYGQAAQYWGDHDVFYVATGGIYHTSGLKTGWIRWGPQEYGEKAADWPYEAHDSTTGWPLGQYRSRHRTWGGKVSRDAIFWQLVP